ncbi:DNA polymerase Y family protein [Thalassobium sp. R2A62]|uniref:Y-family DNA polymerase n=1 Tax=Thalassobium sp. R2A62 TaxID=633131 RepID=UPI0001B1D3BA|nr:DNA polymerase Y family protein [Thalassobium sp. R2A62]EET48917.1 nucleotidyltransferase/DNA polymerase involved in DNA repair [Thalassobium sp. R2A62]MDG1339897.1 DNA polymerase Y family protein [Paracoccaceae bacterium]MDG2454076.1 DNA polymerase Y family protein [Paracoccaceae bacterium]
MMQGDLVAGIRPLLGRRVVSMWFPHLSIERWQRSMERQHIEPPPDVAVTLAVDGAHGPVVHAANPAAIEAGVHTGARIVDMRSLIPELRVEYADVGGDQILLQQLMLWTRRWCPWTSLDGSDGLILDTTGSDHLHDGEALMLADMQARFAQLGLTVRLAVAPTRGAAWGLARYGPERAICPAEDIELRLGALPVKALRLSDKTDLLLNRLGLKTIGALTDVPRVALVRRFARTELIHNPVMRLDQMMGRLAEPVNSPEDPPRFMVRARLPEPVQDPTPHLPALCEALCAELSSAGFGARRIVVSVYKTDGDISHVEAATATGSRDPAHLLGLFRDRIEAINPGYGFDLITLTAAHVEEMADVQSRLGGGTDEGTELAQLVDRLTAKFGAAHVTRPIPGNSHIPERREAWIPAMSGPPAPLETALLRPLRLFHTPEEIRVLYAVPEGPPAQFQWRRQLLRVVRFNGPERISPEWWKDRPTSRLRDYYRIEEQFGRRIWLFREGLHGDGRGREDPRWFVHGVFA